MTFHFSPLNEHERGERPSRSLIHDSLKVPTLLLLVFPLTIFHLSSRTVRFLVLSDGFMISAYYFVPPFVSGEHFTLSFHVKFVTLDCAECPVQISRGHALSIAINGVLMFDD